MSSRLHYLIGAATLLLLATRADPIPHQYVLTLPELSDAELPPLGQLWRFDVQGDAETLRDVLALAEEHDLDLWQVAHSHVDIYSPLSAPPLPTPLRAFPHSLAANISVPEYSNLADNNDEWDLTTLNTTYHADYHPLFEIDRFLQDLALSHPDLVTLHNLGHSGLGREMLSLTISSTGAEDLKGKKDKKKKKGGKQDPKLAFVITGAQHAREWVATATSLYLAHSLVADESDPHSLAHLLDVFDFHIVPVPNPDGYDYTWETDRFWYKTRQSMGNHNKCFGIDMNRNWGYKWKATVDPIYPSTNSTKRSREHADPCSHFYPGHRPFEAPEVNNIANFVTALPNLIGFLDLRSYGQMVSSPFSYSCDELPPDAEDQIEAGLGAAQAIKAVHGTQFTTGRLCSMLYRAPGNILDWMYKRGGIKYSYAVHLRDTGTYGFSLPSRWIRPIGEETTQLVEYLARFIAKQLKREF